MSRLYGIWRTLGIAKTSDISAIRAAYARALKSFEIDDDPARYAALRDARDAALAHARQPQPEISDDDETDDPGNEVEEPLSLGITIPLPDFGAELSAPTLSGVLPPDTPITITPIAPEGDFRPAPSEPVAAAEERTLPLAEVTLTPPVLDLGAAAPLQPINGLPPGFAFAMDQRYNAVLGLLFPQDERRHFHLQGPDLLALRDHVAVLLADPRMEEIAFRADADRWFANVVAQSIPRSDPILDTVMTAFGWIDTRGRIDQPPAVAAIVARHDSLEFVAQVREPGHPLGRAWRELTTPAQENSRKGFRVSGGTVRTLLAKVRREHPDLEDMFDTYRVSLWETPQVTDLAGNWRLWGFGIWIALMIISSLGRVSNDNRSNPSSVPVGLATTLPVTDPLIDRDIDLDAILTDLGGSALTMKALEQRNPKLHSQLATNWRLAQENRNPRFVFARDTRTLLFDRYISGQTRAGYDLLAEHRRLWLEKAKVMRGHGWEACEDFLNSGNVPVLWQSSALIDRQRDMIGRTLLETNGDPQPKNGDGKFSIAGPVIDAATKRAGLSRDLFVKSLNAGGTAKSRCEAYIALAETALALPPKQGLKLLRDL
ncbi:hypothetical protein [Sphingomonas alpina]|uniref:J domain-containing protein n=1 Tax=Sphingomonas alpina TaxID=653931 RepID=A0A7H0LLB8_9SPHN|nr:hypothetical protein [Sphingomonas alpina]QNQ10471.1 hypothetical protein H3Z74_04420 [Sphingomonas alpina]